MISKILSVDKAFGGSKKRKHTKFGVLSIGVDSTDIFSNSSIRKGLALGGLSQMDQIYNGWKTPTGYYYSGILTGFYQKGASLKSGAFFVDLLKFIYSIS